MTAGFVKIRGLLIAIGTVSATHLTDTYADIEGAKMAGGSPGKTWSEIDITTLTDVYKQTTKGIADAGSFELSGIRVVGPDGRVDFTEIVDYGVADHEGQVPAGLPSL